MLLKCFNVAFFLLKNCPGIPGNVFFFCSNSVKVHEMKSEYEFYISCILNSELGPEQLSLVLKECP